MQYRNRFSTKKQPTVVASKLPYARTHTHGSLWATSGAMYLGDPVSPVMSYFTEQLRRARLMTLARPKSMIFTAPVAEKPILSGLRSRCMRILLRVNTRGGYHGCFLSVGWHSSPLCLQYPFL